MNMNSAEATAKQTTTEGPAGKRIGLLLATIGFLLPAIFCVVYLPVYLTVGDILPGALLYLVLIGGLLTLSVGVFWLELRLWRKILMLCFLFLAYAIEILALAFSAIVAFGLGGVF